MVRVKHNNLRILIFKWLNTLDYKSKERYEIWKSGQHGKQRINNRNSGRHGIEKNILFRYFRNIYKSTIPLQEDLGTRIVFPGSKSNDWGYWGARRELKYQSCMWLSSCFSHVAAEAPGL